jgi:ribosomal protein L11 methylase PrmA
VAHARLSGADRARRDDSGAATRLAAAALELAGPVAASVLDVGTGSGALAARALSLGARVVVGVDRDATLVALARSAVPAAEIVEADAEAYLPGLADSAFDLVVANLAAPPLIDLVPELARVARRALVVVGARLWQGRALRRALERARFDPVGTFAADGWCGFAARR